VYIMVRLAAKRGIAATPFSGEQRSAPRASLIGKYLGWCTEPGVHDAC
jgi:hypothetical protein